MNKNKPMVWIYRKRPNSPYLDHYEYARVSQGTANIKIHTSTKNKWHPHVNKHDNNHNDVKV